MRERLLPVPKAGWLVLGVLALVGFLHAQGQKDQPPVKDQVEKDKLPPKDTVPPKDRPNEKDKEIDRTKLDVLIEKINKTITPKALQERLASAKEEDEIFWQTRIDRVFFEYRDVPGGGLTRYLTFAGVCLNGERLKGAPKKPAEVREELKTKLKDLFFSKDLYQELEKRPDWTAPQIDVEQIVVLDEKTHPVPVLQAKTLEPRPASMDGTLFAYARFNADGQLLLDGLVGAPGHLALAQSLLNELGAIAEKRPEWLKQPKWSKDLPSKPEPYMLNLHPWHPTLQEAGGYLQHFLATREGKELEARLCRHTRLLRVHFTYEGLNRKCLIEAECIFPGFDPTEMPESEHRTKLRDALKGACVAAWDKVATPANKFYKPGLAAQIDFPAGKLKKGEPLVAKLQNAAVSDPAFRDLDGMLLEEVTIDPKGNYQVVGFVNLPPHKDRVLELARKVLGAPGNMK